MPERASALERVQVGVEATAGTAVAAATRLLMTRIMPQAMVPTQRYRGAGELFNRAMTIGYEHTEAALEGEAGYNDLVPLLSAHLKSATFSGRTATFTPSVNTANTIKTLSVEKGQAARAEKFAYGVVRDIQLRFTRTEVALGGAVFGRVLTEGATLSTATATLSPVPIAPNGWEVLVGTSADLSDLALLPRVLEAEFRSNNRWSPLFVANTTQASFAAEVERAPDAQARLVMEYDSTGSGYMTQLRASEVRYIRLRAVGPGGATQYSVLVDFPAVFVETNRGAGDDVSQIEYTVEPIFSSGFASGAAIRVTVVSDVTAW